MKHGGEPNTCALCGGAGTISAALGVCRQCILDSYAAAETLILNAHRKARSRFGLPLEPPNDGGQCVQCVNMCRPGEGEMGYCGIRVGKGGAVVQATKGAIVQWYHDPLPTNCVADFVCPGGARCGYPKYSRTSGPEHGYKNLAVFYGACNFSCLFYQNWQFRHLTKARSPVMAADKLASKADGKTTCICFFGGDPSPQIEHALETARIALDGRDLMRICFETNGAMNARYLREMAQLSHTSGGCIKIDLKAANSNLNRALCGTDNRWTLRNFRWLAEFERSQEDRGFPLLIASTLLVPGYVEVDEVEELAGFVASIDQDIPYSLLAFSPSYQMTDLPKMSKQTAKECLAAARKAGLRRYDWGILIWWIRISER